MSGKFEIYKDRAGEFRFRLKASNGQVLLASEGYFTKAGCSNGIESVKLNASIDGQYLRKQTHTGKYMFNLLAGNNQVIATSETYNTEGSLENAIQSVRKNAPDGTIEDLTDK